MSILYLETGSTDPCVNLAVEEHILTHRTEGDWLLLWQNENTVVIGLNQNAAEEIDRDYIEKHHVNLVRRTTGGGAVYHDLGNLNYSFITDLGDPGELSIERFTEPVCRALRGMGLDARTSGRNDILAQGKKVSGVAQRIYKNRVLHHGTLLFDSDLGVLSAALKPSPLKFTSKSTKSVRSRVENIRRMLPEDMSLEQFRQRLLTELSGENIIPAALTREEWVEIYSQAEEKYRSWSWTYGRSPRCSIANRRRFEGGTVELALELKDGLIADISFLGDFMATEPNAPLEQALTGLPFEKEAVAAAMGGMELRGMFGGVSAENLLELMFPEQPKG